MEISINAANAVRQKTKTLKITQEDYDAIRDAIAPVLKAHPDAYAEYQKHGLSDMRYNWDVFRKSGYMKDNMSRLYKYINDTHINAALANILGNSGKAAK